jgi:RimJ/RimL family protein N-acetyltransferase
MAKAQAVLDLRPATIADAERVADLETARTPDDPRDPELLRFSWTAAPAGEVFTRMLAERDGSAIAYLYVGHMHLDRDTDPDRLTKLYELSTIGDRDVPTTVPMHAKSYDEWHHLWFDNPGTRPDRIRIAREGDAIVGLSAIEYPPTRGAPWTAFTTTARRVRGRGIARALKHETIAQAIALGLERIRTQNDGENAPILHINAQMGYIPFDGTLELHRELNS